MHFHLAGCRWLTLIESHQDRAKPFLILKDYVRIQGGCPDFQKDSNTGIAILLHTHTHLLGSPAIATTKEVSTHLAGVLRVHGFVF